MAWTREDTKDVMKKAVGTMIAAAFISLGTAAFSRLDPLIFALIMFVAAAVIVIIIVLQSRSKSDAPSPQERALTPADQPPAPPVQKEVVSEPAIQDAELQKTLTAVDLEAKRIEMEHKLRKKALKVEKKAKKKAEKENEK